MTIIHGDTSIYAADLKNSYLEKYPTASEAQPKGDKAAALRGSVASHPKYVHTHLAECHMAFCTPRRMLMELKKKKHEKARMM
jgi:hypothetical protein